MTYSKMYAMLELLIRNKNSAKIPVSLLVNVMPELRFIVKFIKEQTRVSGYYVIYKNGCGEITEKKSRFIANVFSVGTEEEATSYIDKIRRQYWDAKHNCYAYAVGEHDEAVRFNDDKEPSGTAGKPILDVIQAGGLHNCLIVVTRYFGGVLLGTGGLVRAYTAAAAAGIADAEIRERVEGKRITFSVDYPSFDKINYIAGQMNLTLDNVEYTDKIQAQVLAEVTAAREFTDKLVESTAGRAVWSVEDGVYIYRKMS